MSKPHLSLYKFDSCPFCARVRSAMDRTGVEVELRDVHSDPGRGEELREATGRDTVPVLRIETPEGEVRWLPESLDIIAYLERESR
jgi:glutaredoxin 2